MNEEDEEEEQEEEPPHTWNLEEEEEELHEGAAALLAEPLDTVLEEEQPEPEERTRPATRRSRPLLPYSGRPI